MILNPYNPKRHTDEQVKEQLKNFKKVGFLGGITWNERSGNLVDGHRRVQAMDIYYKYDGTNDYELKVEVVNLDDKEEKEQMTYMAIRNTKADYNLIAQYIGDIDAKSIGLTDDDIIQINNFITPVDNNFMADWGNDFIAPTFDLLPREDTFEQIAQKREEMPHASADEIRAKKQTNTQTAQARNAERAYVLVQFDSKEYLETFCDALGLDYTQENIIVNGLDLLKMLDA